MLRSVILAASRSHRVERLVETAPLTRDVVRRFVAGTGTDDALRATRELVGDGLAGHPRPPRRGHGHARAGRRDPRANTSRCSPPCARRRPDARPPRSASSSRRSARSSTSSWRTTTRAAICAAATEAGTTVTLDMEDHTTTDSTLEILGQAAQGLPDDRRGAAGLPAPHRGRLPRAGHDRLPGAAVQGRLQGARVGGVPVGRRRGQVVRALHEHPDVRRRATRCWPPTTRD